MFLELDFFLCKVNYDVHTDDEDGSESLASSGTPGSEDQPDHHLLTVPNIDVAFLKEKPTRLARELL